MRGKQILQGTEWLLGEKKVKEKEEKSKIDWKVRFFSVTPSFPRYLFFSTLF